MSPGSIIVGSDSGPGGEDALALGVLLGGVAESKLVVTRVLPWPRDLIGAEDLERALEVETRADFAAMSDRLGPGVQFRAVADRSPARGLDEVAREARARLIVVGSSHRGRLGRTLLGSVASALLHGAPCAVAVAPKGFAAKTSPRLGRVGAAIDGSAESWAALETATGLADRAGGELLLVTVVEPPRYGYSEAISVLSSEGIRTVEREGRERLLELALGSVPDGVRAETRLMMGNAGRLLAEVSADLDLMVCGSRGYGPILHTVLGSSSRALVENASCPVVVTPRGSGMDPLGLRRERAYTGTAA